jgi:hypothetical protein
VLSGLCFLFLESCSSASSPPASIRRCLPGSGGGAGGGGGSSRPVWLARGAGEAGMEVPGTSSAGAGGEGAAEARRLTRSCGTRARDRSSRCRRRGASSSTSLGPQRAGCFLGSCPSPLQRFLIKVVDSPYSRSAKLLFQFRSFCSCDFFVVLPLVSFLSS